MAKATGVSVRDTVLWVEDSGEVDLPVLLCLHSLWLDRTMFDDLARAAAGRYRVVRPDFRGQGKSAPPTTDIIDMDTCAADMDALIDTLKLGPVNLVAQSMGGDAGIRMVARRPDLFRSFVMLGSSARGEPPEQLAWLLEWHALAREAGFVGDALQTLREIMFGASTRKDPAKQAMLKHWSDKMEASPHSLWPAIRGVTERESAVELLPRITTPTLVISGTEDLPRPPAWSDEVVAHIPNSRLFRLECVGHSPVLEAPEQVIPEILRFVDTLQ